MLKEKVYVRQQNRDYGTCIGSKMQVGLSTSRLGWKKLEAEGKT